MVFLFWTVQYLLLDFRGLWPRRGSNPQPSGYPDRESDALATAPREFTGSGK